MVALLSGVGAISASMLLRQLPYSTAEVETIDASLASAPPGETQSSLGGVVWNLAAYRTASELEAFRRYRADTCAEAVGLQAALCISDDMATRFGHGEPEQEPFDPTYDPVSALATHVAGRAGHCVTRSSLIVASLLATGTPARMLQLIRPDGVGHNLLEVWSGGRWVAFDPSLGVAFARRDQPHDLLGASEIATAGPVTLVQLGRVPVGAAPLQSFYSKDPRLCFEGARLYPEPWLYLRVGERAATWPMRARFALTGTGSATLGPLQAALRFLVLGLATVAAASSAMSFLRWRGARRAALPDRPVIEVTRAQPRGRSFHHGRGEAQSRLRDATPSSQPGP